MDCISPGFPVLHHLLELTQTHVHWVGDATNHLILCRPLHLLPSIFPSIRVFSTESALRIRWPKYGSFSFSSSPRDSQESSPTPQLKSIDSLTLSLLYDQLSHPYMTTGKTIALTKQTFVSNVMSLLFNMLSRFVIAFSSKEQASFNFMAAVTVHNDFGTQENSPTLFPLFPHLYAMKWWERIPWS